MLQMPAKRPPNRAKLSLKHRYLFSIMVSVKSNVMPKIMSLVGSYNHFL